MHAIARNAATRRRAVISFLLFFILVLFVLVFFHLIDILELERIRRNDFEIAAALGAGHYVPFFDVILFDVQIGVTFGTQNHCIASVRGPLHYKI